VFLLILNRFSLIATSVPANMFLMSLIWSDYFLSASKPQYQVSGADDNGYIAIFISLYADYFARAAVRCMNSLPHLHTLTRELSN